MVLNLWVIFGALAMILLAVSLAGHTGDKGGGESAKGWTTPPPNLESKVQEISNATAFAEGYMDARGNVLANNVPAQFNNPGDLGPGDAPGYTAEWHGGSLIVRFPDAATGWNSLNTKWRRILTGASTVYSLDDSFTAVAKRYAGDWYNWVKNVTSYLGVKPGMTLREWVNQP